MALVREPHQTSYFRERTLRISKHVLSTLSAALKDVVGLRAMGASFLRAEFWKKHGTHLARSQPYSSRNCSSRSRRALCRPDHFVPRHTIHHSLQLPAVCL